MKLRVIVRSSIEIRGVADDPGIVLLAVRIIQVQHRRRNITFPSMRDSPFFNRHSLAGAMNPFEEAGEHRETYYMRMMCRRLINRMTSEENKQPTVCPARDS